METGRPTFFFEDLPVIPPLRIRGKVVLSTDRGTKPFSLEPPIESSIEIRGGGHFLVADMNGDGFDDWITYNDSYPQRLSLFFGFEPLRHPTLGIDRTDGGSRRAELAFSVGGQPTEMKVGGAISDGFRDQWIPYRSALGVTCTPESGPKNINAVFRNAVGRESEPVAVTATLEVRESRVVTFTNAFRHGGRAAWDCSLPEGGPMRAWMVDGRGREVKELTNGDYPPGVATVEWDGTNAAGNPVAPGVYRLVLDVQGRKEYRVLLEP